MKITTIEITDNIIDWLLQGDVSIQYQVYRDLLGKDRLDLQKRIPLEGWGARFLDARKPNGHWGLGFYQRKWTSTHYTLLDIKNLNMPSTKEIQETIQYIIKNEKGHDGGINPSGTVNESDVCINGMFLNYASYYKADLKGLKSVVDFIVSQQMPDGGFNCRKNRSGAKHSSVHSTLSVMEGIHEYALAGYKYRVDELKQMELDSREFLLHHKLFQSHRTGQIIDKRFLMLSYPCRWRYDILRALNYFQVAKCNYDERMSDALNVLFRKRRKDFTWPVQNKHAGATHVDMEKTGTASRWNTLRALKVLKYYEKLG